MKVDNMEGEFFFKALVKWNGSSGWQLSEYYFQTIEEVKFYCDTDVIIWPVEAMDGGTVYAPSPQEFNQLGEETNVIPN